MKRSLIILALTSLLLTACATQTRDIKAPAQAATPPPHTPCPTCAPCLIHTPYPTYTPYPTLTPLPVPTDTTVPTEAPTATSSPGPTSLQTEDPDPDRDGISTSEESTYGTDPSVAEPWNEFSFVSRVLNTPEKIAYYMRHHLGFMYDEAGQNYFQSAQETFARGGGDCEDSAMFPFELLNQNGWSFMGNGWEDTGNWVGGFNVQWVETDPRGGHAVCLYKPSGGALYYIDNDIRQLGIVRGPFADLEQVVADIAARSQGGWRWYEFFDTSWNFGYGRVDRP